MLLTALLLALGLSLATAENAVCLLCEIEMEHIASTIPKNYTVAEFDHELQNGCAKVPSLQKQCDALVVLYGRDIFEAITGGVPADKVCEFLHLCNSSSVVAVEASNAVTTAPSDPIVCEVCEQLFANFTHNLPANFTRQELDSLLYFSCSLLGKFETYCDALVLLYGQDFYEIMSGGAPPSEVCRLLHLCPNSTLSTSVALIAQSDSQSLVCDVCELVLKEITNALPKNFSLQEFDQYANAICNLLGPLTSYCDMLLLLFGTDFYNGMTGKVSALQECTEAHLCNPNMSIDELVALAHNSQSQQQQQEQQQQRQIA